ncbi:hypothetical protein FOZ60_013203 [Perkinsus olseni]|uniref:Cytochrome P450-dit2 n=1 Tax=Perkinsus olseni TaxID=32597 RepID=A0A7J6P8P0_PEROL|nr:hypothetical protein FOZ60_013203 [Perkinsus olseni]
MLSALSAGISPEIFSIVRRYAPRAVGGGAVLLASLCVAKLIATLIKSIKPVPFPGPKGVPFFGMALQLDQKKALACMRVWNKQYGKTIGFRVFSTPYVVTQKPETIRQLMKDRVKGYHMRQFNSLDLLPRSGVFLSEGDHWRLNRKAAEPALSESSADSMVPTMTQMAKRMVNIVATLADSSGVIEDWVPHQWFRRCTLDFTVATHFGKDYNLQNTLGRNTAFVYHRQTDIPSSLRFKAGATPKTNVLDKLLNMHKGDLTWNLVTFILAGSASASATMEWFVYLMCANKDIQSAARAEEIQRQLRISIQSSTPGPLPSITTAPYTIEGRPVEVGTIIIMMMDEAMKSEERGGDSFRPENWFLPGTKEINRDLARDHWAFSCGPRKCPGQTLAVKECTIIAAFLLRHFDDMRFTLGYDDVKETMWLNRVPENLKVTMSLRNY